MTRNKCGGEVDIWWTVEGKIVNFPLLSQCLASQTVSSVKTNEMLPRLKIDKIHEFVVMKEYINISVNSLNIAEMYAFVVLQ